MVKAPAMETPRAMETLQALVLVQVLVMAEPVPGDFDGDGVVDPSDRVRRRGRDPGLEPEPEIIIEPPAYTGELDTQVPTLPAALLNYTVFDFDGGFEDQLQNTFIGNPNTDIGATLGRVLFYDVNLSANNTKACASCHIQEYGFSDPNAFSEWICRGHDGGRKLHGFGELAIYRQWPLLLG